jgi:hypothetical protein
MGEETERFPDLPRLLGTLAGLLLLLGALSMGVIVVGGSSAHRILEPTTTADGSTCDPISGACSDLSRSAIEEKTGIVIPRGSRVLHSGSRSAFTFYEAWAVACVPDAGLLLDQSENSGFVPATPSDYPTRQDWNDKGPSVLEPRPVTMAQGEQWLELGSNCEQGTYVYLGDYLDK